MFPTHAAVLQHSLCFTEGNIIVPDSHCDAMLNKPSLEGGFGVTFSSIFGLDASGSLTSDKKKILNTTSISITYNL